MASMSKVPRKFPGQKWLLTSQSVMGEKTFGKEIANKIIRENDPCRAGDKQGDGKGESQRVAWGEILQSRWVGRSP